MSRLPVGGARLAVAAVLLVAGYPVGRRDGACERNLTCQGGGRAGGTMYPTSMFDSNGNWITLTYNNGVGVPKPVKPC